MSNYDPYIDPETIKSFLNKIVSFNEQASAVFMSDSGGVVIDSELLNTFQSQGEAYALRQLNTLYKIPLQRKDTGETDIKSFSPMTRHNLEAIFIDATCRRLISYIIEQQGNSVYLRNYYDKLTDNYNRNINLSLEKDSAGGRIYPAYPELELSDLYLTREETPTPKTKHGKNMPILSRNVQTVGKANIKTLITKT
jgi:hypothetical protein